MKILFKTLLTIAPVGLLLLASGCCKGDRGRLVKEWSSMIREQQVAPIFPPREDIRVGDMFLTLKNPDAEEFSKRRGYAEIPVLMGRLNQETNLKNAYYNRPPYPLTPTNELERIELNTTFTEVSTNKEGVVTTNTTTTTGPALLVLPATAEAKDVSIYSAQSPDRLRHVAFPEFSYSKISSQSVQAVIPAESLMVAVAATATQAKEAYVKISSGESVSLPAPVVFTEFISPAIGIVTNHSSGKVRVLGSTWSDLVNRLAGKASGTNAPEFYLTLINEVFYARTVDVNFTAKKSSGGGVNVAGSPLANPVNATAAAVERVRQLNLANAELLSKNTPGGSITFTAASDYGMGLRRTYARPIAIGYRGLVLHFTNGVNGWELGKMVAADIGPMNTLNPVDR